MTNGFHRWFRALAELVGTFGSSGRDRSTSAYGLSHRGGLGLFSEERFAQIPPRLRVSGAIEVVFHQHPIFQLRVSVEDASMLRRVSTKVQAGVLVVEMIPDVRVGSVLRRARGSVDIEGYSGRVIVGVAAPRMHEITVSGAASVDLTSLHEDDVDLNVTGSGRIRGAGSSTNLTATLSGAGSILCDEFSATNLRCSVEGAGRIRICATSRVRARVSGAGSLMVFGEPSERDIGTSGAGSIKFGGPARQSKHSASAWEGAAR
ncbi:GIN domain-containing protein [Ralstonia pseudosolanacearum]|uniref:GIN domain-containing protein n=1 Tax=Ralstonia pseudosolanacearum TaxID=1310165 RepID=UPI003CFA08FF